MEKLTKRHWWQLRHRAWQAASAERSTAPGAALSSWAFGDGHSRHDPLSPSEQLPPRVVTPQKPGRSNRDVAMRDVGRWWPAGRRLRRVAVSAFDARASTCGMRASAEDAGGLTADKKRLHESLKIRGPAKLAGAWSAQPVPASPRPPRATHRPTAACAPRAAAEGEVRWNVAVHKGKSC